MISRTVHFAEDIGLRGLARANNRYRLTYNDFLRGHAEMASQNKSLRRLEEYGCFLLLAAH
jgi:hypothetical protein